jgi:primosomal protein N' (replication factor Y)
VPDAILRLALPSPLRRLFDYRAPAGVRREQLQPGMRLRVPFGRREMIGILVEVTDTSEVPAEKLKPALALLDTTSPLPPALFKLCLWTAQYYQHSLGDTLNWALPVLLRQGELAEARQERFWSIAPGASVDDPRVARAPRQREALTTLAQHPHGVAHQLLSKLMLSKDSLDLLLAKGLVQVEIRRHAPGVRHEHWLAQPELPLNSEQRAAYEAIRAGFDSYHAFLLAGVTGSGKTEVYLHAVERTLRRGRRALVLVPEIGLTPQLVGRFRERFAVPLALLHSGLTDSERLAAWRECASGAARIVLGTRSAVFAPVADLGVVIIDEEHDASFKQHESGFRYSARDLAILRAQRAGVPIVLGSATPSLETLQNVATGKYTRLSLPRRTGQAVPPRAAVIDLREHAVRQGISTPAVEAMQRHLADDGQVLVYINRRGYSPTLACTACGWIAPCRDCDARLTVHLGAARLRCHHCGADAPLPAHCPQCGYAVRHVGQGTERVEETLAALFPEVSIARLDRDVVRKRGDLEEVVGRIASGAARILVGTQMVTKGHDFPSVTLVVVLNADQGLFSTDFRAPERLAQTIIQVAGRAGRGTKPGEVMIQTEYPEHPLLKSLLADGYDGFAHTALAERAAAGWPPFAHIVALRASAPALPEAVEFLRAARKLARAPREVKLLGPAPAAMAKRAARYHAQVLLEARDRAPLHRLLAEWLPQVEEIKVSRNLRWSIDVDPIELF